MDEGSHPQPLSGAGGQSQRNHHHHHKSNPHHSHQQPHQYPYQQHHPQQQQQRGNNGPSGGPAPSFNLQNEIIWINQDAMQVRNAVILLEQEKDSLRKAIRKLKLENTRMKQKVKGLQEAVAKLTGTTKENGTDGGCSEAELDYDDIGRDFYLVGGIHDPLSLRFEAPIRDADGVEHKSAERFYWYKMAETFQDGEAMRKVLQAPNVNAAEEAMKEISQFDEQTWDTLKLRYWEEGQRMKLSQVRWITNLLVMTKCFGTGWRKNREESNKPIFWDGQNEGGKILMHIRQELKAGHTWESAQEEEETEKKFKEMQRFVWRRIDLAKRIQMGAIGGGGGGGGGRGMVGGGRGGRGMPTPSSSVSRRGVGGYHNGPPRQQHQGYGGGGCGGGGGQQGYGARN